MEAVSVDYLYLLHTDTFVYDTSIFDVLMQRLLACGDKTNSELSDEVGERVETVSRKLKKLRDIGAADFRRDGVHVYNFLTPAAKALARATRNKGVLPEPRKTLSVVVSQKLGNLDSFWNNIPDFSNDDALQSAQA